MNSYTGTKSIWRCYDEDGVHGVGSSDGWLCAVDSGFKFLWWVESAGRSVSGSLIISGASSRFPACVGDALGVRGSLLPFLSVFPFAA